MSDGQQREDEELQQLAAAVDQACRPAAPTRPRSISELRNALGDAGAARLSPAEIIARLRASRARSGRDPANRPGAPGGLPGAP